MSDLGPASSACIGSQSGKGDRPEGGGVLGGEETMNAP